MEVITIDQAVQAYAQSREIRHVLFGALLDAASQNVMTYFGSTVYAFHMHDWKLLAVNLFMLFAGAILVYRLVGRSLLRLAHYLLDR